MKFLNLEKGQKLIIKTPNGEVQIVNFGQNERGPGIKLGIDAPRSIRVDRKEIAGGKL